MTQVSEKMFATERHKTLPNTEGRTINGMLYLIGPL
jgi:hypothetical protein